MENNIILTANGFNDAAPRSAKIDELFENITTLNDGEFIITSYRNVNHGKPTETEG